MRAFLALLVVASVAQGGMMPRKIIDFLKTAKFHEACWGEEAMHEWHEKVMAATDKCMLQEPTFTEDTFFNYNERVARQAEGEDEDEDVMIPGMDEEKMEMFQANFAKVKEMKVTVLSNLTCVMKELHYWNEDNSVNMDYFMKDKFEGADYEEDFVTHLKEAYQLCHKLSEAVPVEDLKNPMKKMFGKQLMFQKCIYKASEEICALKEIAEWHDKKHGAFDAEKAAKLGLPKDRYMAAFMGKMVYLHSKPAPVKYITSMLFTGKADF